MSLSPKKLILLGFVVVLLVAIPLTVYLVQQQQKTKTGAQPATTLKFIPSTTNAKVGDTINVDINVDPSNINQVTFLKVAVKYDPAKLSTSQTDVTINSWQTSSGSTFKPTVLAGPTVDNTAGTITFTLSTGNTPQNVITAPTRVATVNFKALATTGSTPTQVSFGAAPQTDVRSLGTSDQYSEPVLSSAPPIAINIADLTASPTPSITPSVSPTVTPSATPTVSPSPTAVVTAAPEAPVCSSLTLDRSATGTAPYAITFTVNGSSTVSNITKVTFDFGDGQNQDLTQTGGIGTQTVSAVTSHTYSTAGNYTATATLTDSNGNASVATNCTQAITISDAGTVTATPTVAITAQPTLEASATPTLAPTGPGNTVITVGALGAILSVLGLVILFAL